MSSPSLLPGQPGPLKPGEYVPPGPPNIVSFEFDRISPPSPAYVQRDDVLVLEVASSFQPLTVTFQWRMLLAPFAEGGQPQGRVALPSRGRVLTRGKIEPGRQDFVYTGASGVTQQVQIPLTEGFLLSVSAFDSSNSQRGATFARAFIARGISSALTPAASYIFFSDYTTQNHPIGWPGGRALYPTEGPGFLTRTSLGQPGAGADFTFTVPNNVRLRVQSIFATLTTSAVVGSRLIRFRHSDISALNLLASNGNQTIPAATGANLTAASGLTGVAAVPGVVVVPLPTALWARAGDTLTVERVSGGDPGDQWSSISMYAEQWLDNGNA